MPKALRKGPTPSLYEVVAKGRTPEVKRQSSQVKGAKAAGLAGRLAPVHRGPPQNMASLLVLKVCFGNSQQEGES